MGTARIMITSKMRTTEIIRHVTCSALDGVAKNSSTMSRRPMANVVYEKSKKPEPRECIAGGLTKIETSSSTHHRKVITANRTVKYLRNLTDHRLYGDTWY